MALQTSDSSSFTTTLPAPLENVFALLTNPFKMPQWLPGCRHVSVTGPVKKDARLTVQFHHGTSEFVVTDFAPPEIFGWIERGAREGSKTIFKLEFAGSQTNVTMRQVWAPRSLRAWLLGAILRRRNARRMFESAMGELRRLVGR